MHISLTLLSNHSAFLTEVTPRAAFQLHPNFFNASVYFSLYMAFVLESLLTKGISTKASIHLTWAPHVTKRRIGRLMTL